jgi:hypothetical protein
VSGAVHSSTVKDDDVRFRYGPDRDAIARPENQQLLQAESIGREDDLARDNVSPAYLMVSIRGGRTMPCDGDFSHHWRLHRAEKNVATSDHRFAACWMQALSAFFANSYRRATALVTGILLLRAPIAVGLDVRGGTLPGRPDFPFVATSSKGRTLFYTAAK